MKKDADIMETGVEGTLEEQKQWFVMRDLKRTNASLPAYLMLAEEKYEVFTPLKWVIQIKKGRRIRKQVPFIQNLLFVHGKKSEIDIIVNKTPTLQYRFQKGQAYCQPMVVRDSDMERFLRAVSSVENPHYYLPEELTPQMIGRTIQIIGGPLDGYQGTLLKRQGAKKKQLLVELPGFFSAGIEVEAEYVSLV